MSRNKLSRWGRQSNRRERYGQLQHDPTTEGRGRRFENTIKIAPSKGFGPGKATLDCNRCGKPVKRLYYGDNGTKLGGVCRECRDAIRGSRPPRTRKGPYLISKPSVDGYQAGLARYPGDEEAYVNGKAELDRKMAQRGLDRVKADDIGGEQ